MLLGTTTVANAMRLTIEVLDQKTLCWNLLARHDGVGLDAAPGIVAVLRDGLPAAASIRWNWSRMPPGTDGSAPAVVQSSRHDQRPARPGRPSRKRGRCRPPAR